MLLLSSCSRGGLHSGMVSADAQVRTPVSAKEEAASFQYFNSVLRPITLSVMALISPFIECINSSLLAFSNSLARAVRLFAASADDFSSATHFKASPEIFSIESLIQAIDRSDGWSLFCGQKIRVTSSNNLIEATTTLNHANHHPRG